ncbi:FAD/NAD(P)-binding domain-containing protein [Aspergillus campestris IBT 28561]|uniref:FAD/NAD(P)-binding domain-containing protein n=1 Tax=Aspergillus campestris (strain IBT 28561) TaxID=1392248 RepID=A0A2I1DDM2_ASPC2|nr:FAD/NAD(P)-binding domain-containing protein [Aspergillus campestris IBT 28561]PKY07982.1 FAD/NAD(P)-binding domain-containing protein [Aspergillus campestris IBT 28561]
MAITHNDDENIAYELWIGTTITVAAATIAVVLRWTARRVSHVGYGWDDYTIMIALVVNWITAILRWIQIIYFGLGHHADQISEAKVVGYLKVFMPVQILYLTNTSITKASILLLYARIFGVVTRFRWVLIAAGSLVAAFWVSCVIVTLAGCRPFSAFWDLVQTGQCHNGPPFTRTNAIINMCLDVLMLCLPFPMLWRIHTTRRQKVILMSMFALGGFVCVVSILRIVSFVYHTGRDPTFATVPSSNWSQIEQSVGIVCACLPTLRPLFRRLYGNVIDSTHTGSSSTPISRNRLQPGSSGNPSLRVAVVEAGGFYEVGNGNRSIVPAYCALYTGSDPGDTNPHIDWGFQTTPQPGAANRRIHYPRGKTLGGTSARNYMTYHRPSAGAMQRWAEEVGDNSYLFDNMMPFFQRSGHYTPPNDALYHNSTNLESPDAFSAAGGPLQISFGPVVDAFATWVRHAYIAAGMPQIAGFNSGDLLGSSWAPSTIDPRNAHRSSSESSFLRAALSDPATSSVLTIYPSTLALRILFEHKTATGVQVTTAGTFGTPPLEFTLHARKEVILSAGAVQSPQLLLASGVGPCADLAGVNVPCTHHLPGVGQNLQDHVLFGASRRVNVLTASAAANNASLAAHNEHLWNCCATGPLSLAVPGYYGWEKLPPSLRAHLSASTRRALDHLIPADWPELEWLAINAYVGDSFVKGTDPLDGHNYGTISAGLVAPFSRGTVSLRTADMRDPPLIDPQWLTHPVDKDLAVQAFRRVRHIWNLLVEMGVADCNETYPGRDVGDGADEIAAFIAGSMGTIFHPAGTCKMGRAADGMAVVDTRARVFGLRRLRVVDASSFPFLTPGHPQSVVYALAEKIAADILNS